MKPGAGTTAISLKRQASSSKLQAASWLPDIIVPTSSPEGARKSEKKLRQIVAGQYDAATKSHKHQAPSAKLRHFVAGAISYKLQATSYKLQATSTRIPDSSSKRQALKII